MDLITLLKKARNQTWGRARRAICSSRHYPKLFASYWYYRFHQHRSGEGREFQYLSARPNPGAGIGHQMANWIAGYWWARQFGLQYAHSRFPSLAWETFLGFGENEITVEELAAKPGYKVVKLPPFREKNPMERELLENIIASYGGRKTVFLMAQDQSYGEQIGVIEDLQRKFHAAPTRKNDRLIFSADQFNIAVHVRRGDIVAGQQNGNPNLKMRWQDNDYFHKVLGNVLKVLRTDKPVAIYLFSQGKPEEFKEFAAFDNLHLCLGMGARDSFLHMVFADLLITSKSSFSYKPALLSKGIRACPKDFWHGYPDDPKWILAEADGSIPAEQIPANGRAI